MKYTIQVPDKLFGISKDKINEINQVPSKLATHFYLSKTKNVSYYYENLVGDLLLWNKGTKSWETTNSPTPPCLYTLPAESPTEIQETVKKESFKTNLVDEEDQESSIEITSVKTESVISSDKSLLNLFEQFLPEKYFIGIPPLGEIAYTVMYDRELFRWSSNMTFSDTFAAGAIFTNSSTCAKKVAEYLNSNNTKPNQI